MKPLNDLDRLRVEYADRERRFSGSDIYSFFNPAHLFFIQRREQTILQVLNKYGFRNLTKQNVLEIGCGSGGVLIEFLIFGAKPYNLHGIDLMPNLLQEAHHRNPAILISNSDGQHLPYMDRWFNIILGFTVFSSILDDHIKQNIANEMMRVLKPDGIILWYDFWLNPTNPQTRGIRPPEIRHLFPNCTYEFHKITLAPPLARRIVPFSWGFAFLLESLKIFNTHYLIAIRPKIQA